jgi:hypothetical protein
MAYDWYAHHMRTVPDDVQELTSLCNTALQNADTGERLAAAARLIDAARMMTDLGSQLMDKTLEHVKTLNRFPSNITAADAGYVSDILYLVRQPTAGV